MTIDKKYETVKTTDWQNKFVIAQAGDLEQVLQNCDPFNGDCPLCFATEELANQFIGDMRAADPSVGDPEEDEEEMQDLGDVVVVEASDAQFKEGDNFYEVILASTTHDVGQKLEVC